jgi:hypothetical protein
MCTTEEHVARRRQQQRDRPQQLVEHGITEMYVSHCDFVVTWGKHPEWRWWEWQDSHLVMPVHGYYCEACPQLGTAEMQATAKAWQADHTVFCRPLLKTPHGLTLYSQWYLPETDPGWEGHTGYVENAQDRAFVQALDVTPDVIQRATRLTYANAEGFIARRRGSLAARP